MKKLTLTIIFAVCCSNCFAYYQAQQGRWMSRDPIEEAGGKNLFAFVNNNSVNNIDHLGLALYSFDGTGTQMDTWTHVSILHRSYYGQKFYERGVGSDWYSTLGGGIFGLGGNSRLDDMYKNLVDAYSGGDTDIDIIGFSRGSSLAREFANMIYENGITDYRGILGRKKVLKCDPKIRFVGLFDTVGSFGIPGNDLNIGIRMDLPPNVIYAAQAVAANERRSAFPLTPLNTPSSGQTFDQTVFPGDHSDIGGGHRENQNYLAVRPLFYMHSQGLSAGVPFGQLNLKFENGELFLYVNGQKRPWAYQASYTPHDLTDKWYYGDGGPRQNLP